MGWFNKKEEAGKKMMPANSVSELPRLPELPPLRPKTGDNLPKLPSMPSSSFGEKFSQNTIKDAVSRKTNVQYPEEKEGRRAIEADDFGGKNFQMMQRPSGTNARKFSFPKTEEIEEPEMDFESFEEPEYEEPKYEEPAYEEESFSSSRKQEPVFIRIDKFEEAMRVFEKTKKEVADIEKILKEINTNREEEEKVIQSWQDDVLKIKDQIEKVDRDIFSKIE
jgi:hypothetical protein